MGIQDGWRKIGPADSAEFRLDAVEEEFWREIRVKPLPSPEVPSNIDFKILAEARRSVSCRLAIRGALGRWALVAASAAAVFTVSFLVLSGLVEYAVPAKVVVNNEMAKLSEKTPPPLPSPTIPADFHHVAIWGDSDIGDELSLLELELELQELNLRAFAFK